jgi:catechol 2,3-dioxygenase-like lactoylglutathione lyase family enzyme
MEVAVSTIDMRSENSIERPESRTVDFRLEVVVLPVSDAERAKQFYASLGWREDADFVISAEYRVLQFTPPGSPTSIIFGTGITDALPGSIDGLLLAVGDIETARAELIDRGVEVSEVFHDAGGGLGGGFHAGTTGRAAGRDPDGRSYGSYASFSDPDGNGWLLQEVTTRLPGRVTPIDTATLAGLLHETASNHDAVEKAAAAHDWWDWYAPYLSAREQGNTVDEATEAADRYLKEARGVVVPR